MFKRHVLNATDLGYYFNCQGYCAECKASINIWCPKIPQNVENVTLNLKLDNVNKKNIPILRKDHYQEQREERFQNDFVMAKWQLIGGEKTFRRIQVIVAFIL